MRLRARGDSGRPSTLEAYGAVLAYLVRRVLWSFVLLFALTLVTYVIFFVLPSEPARFRRGLASEPTDISRAFDLQGSLVAEYGQFVWNFAAHGSLGHSFATRRSVTDMLVD